MLGTCLSCRRFQFIFNSEMANLTSLSTELILAICTHLQLIDIRSISLTTRKLYQIANPRFYEYVYFWGTDNKDTEERVFNGANGQYFARQQAPSDATRIYNLDALTISILGSALLRSYLNRVDLTWAHREGMDEDARDIHNRYCKAESSTQDNSKENFAAPRVSEDEEKVLRFLDAVRDVPLISLTLSPPGLYFQVPAYAAVTSLRLRHKGPYGGLYKNVAPDIDQLHKQCCIASLDEVFIDGWLFWSDSVSEQLIDPMLNTDMFQRRAKTSPLTSMRISSMGPPGVIFDDILGWPRSLRIFWFECSPYDGLRYAMPGILCSEDFIRPLQHCRDTLEELVIRGASSLSGNVFFLSLKLPNSYPILILVSLNRSSIVSPPRFT